MVLAAMEGLFTVARVEIPAYELGDRCPLAVLRPAPAQ
jgi:hypothetical protein